MHLGADPESQITYGSEPDELDAYRADVAERAAGFRVRAIADIAGVSIGTVSAVRPDLSSALPSRETLAAIDRAVDELATEADTPAGGPDVSQDDR